MVSVRVCPYQLADRCRHPWLRDGAVVENPGILPLAGCAMRGRRDGRGDRVRPICNGMSHMRHADVKGGASGMRCRGAHLQWDVAYATCRCKKGGLG